eukprot:1175498-Prorocentrum_minimum.AAC.1
MLTLFTTRSALKRLLLNARWHGSVECAHVLRCLRNDRVACHAVAFNGILLSTHTLHCAARASESWTSAAQGPSEDSFLRIVQTRARCRAHEWFKRTASQASDFPTLQCLALFRVFSLPRGLRKEFWRKAIGSRGKFFLRISEICKKLEARPHERDPTTSSRPSKTGTPLRPRLFGKSATF